MLILNKRLIFYVMINHSVQLAHTAHHGFWLRHRFRISFYQFPMSSHNSIPMDAPSQITLESILRFEQVFNTGVKSSPRPAAALDLASMKLKMPIGDKQSARVRNRKRKQKQEMVCPECLIRADFTTPSNISCSICGDVWQVKRKRPRSVSGSLYSQRRKIQILDPIDVFTNESHTKKPNSTVGSTKRLGLAFDQVYTIVCMKNQALRIDGNKKCCFFVKELPNVTQGFHAPPELSEQLTAITLPVQIIRRRTTYTLCGNQYNRFDVVRI
jgi:hypothetical protein